MVFNWPQVMQVKPFWSYLGTKTQWPPQLPFLALAPPLGNHVPHILVLRGQRQRQADINAAE